MSRKKRIGLKEVLATLNEFNAVRLDQLGNLLEENLLDNAAIARIAAERQLVNTLKNRFITMEEEDDDN